MDNSLRPIEQFVQHGLAQRFQQVFGLPLAYSNSPDKKASANKLLRRGWKYPFAFAAVQADGVTEGTYKPHALWRRGMVSQLSDDNAVAFRLNLIPVTTEYEITLLADAFSDVRRFNKLWLLGSIQKALKFSITYGVVDIDINVDAEQKIQVPPREGGLTEVGEYNVVTNCTVHGYMSADELAKAQAVTDVEATGYVGDPADLALMTKHERGTHEVFYFRSSQPELSRNPENQ